jgi:hypothetical protein
VAHDESQANVVVNGFELRDDFFIDELPGKPALLAMGVNHLPLILPERGWLNRVSV